jgi:dTDP-4-dehydrorhamnose reductase
MALATADYFKLEKSFIKEADGSTFSQKAKRPAKTGFNIEKAKSVLGYQPHSFEEGIAILASQI